LAVASTGEQVRYFPTKSGFGLLKGKWGTPAYTCMLVQGYCAREALQFFIEMVNSDVVPSEQDIFI
jgi:uncharacterized membrane protein